MTDRELLEKAAKAAGIDLVWHLELDNKTPFCLLRSGGLWNPLTDDGDALRLAVKLHFVIDTGAISTSVHANNGVRDLGYEFHDSDPYAATRRAIVRAAAAMSEE